MFHTNLKLKINRAILNAREIARSLTNFKSYFSRQLHFVNNDIDKPNDTQQHKTSFRFTFVVTNINGSY
jgi:hypothetical protein